MTDALALLERGELELIGRIGVASNATFLGEVTLEGERLQCVYKPVAGEVPLWDFPEGTLAQREYATFLLSEALGWGLVAPTVVREGRFGIGTVQAWVEHNPDLVVVDLVPEDEVPEDWFLVADGYFLAPQEDSGTDDGGVAPGDAASDGAVDEHGTDDEDDDPRLPLPVVLTHSADPALARLAVFDLVVNNADRKGGHVLVTQDAPEGPIGVVGVDHGLTLHADDKLRTVLWGWAEEPIPGDLVADLRALAPRLTDGELADRLAVLLEPAELDALRSRVDALLADPRFPPLQGPRRLPWPPL